MNDVVPHALEDIWKRRFDLYGRGAPEFYESADAVRNSPHAGAIRATLEMLGASAVFCVQGVPTIVLLNSEQYERDTVVSLHAALWSQGLASLLLVLTGVRCARSHWLERHMPIQEMSSSGAALSKR
jgi:hypothetical protein